LELDWLTGVFSFMFFICLDPCLVRPQFGSPSLRQTATASETVISCGFNGAQSLST